MMEAAAPEYTVDDLFSLGENDDVEHMIPEAVDLDLVEHDNVFTVEEVLDVQLLDGNVVPGVDGRINHEEQHGLPASDTNLPTAEGKSDLFANLYNQLQAHLLSDDDDESICEFSQDLQNTMLLVDIPGADSMQSVCGVSQRDGDASVEETFHQAELGYAESEFTWPTVDDFNGTWFAGCSMAQPQADSQQTFYSAFHQSDLESGERMLMSDTPGPLEISNPTECIQLSDLPAELYESSEDLQADCGVTMYNFHDEPAWLASSGGSLPECAHAKEAIPVSNNMVKRGQSLLESKPRLKRRKKLDPIECIQLSDLPAELNESSEDLQADCGVTMGNFHDEPAWLASSGGSLPECAHAKEAIPVSNNMVKRGQSLLESKPRLKRRKELASKSYVGVKRRCNGKISSFEANYAPPGSDGKVFLGEFSTPEEAKDAYNLVALLYAGTDAKIDLEPYEVERYLHEVKAWQGKFIVDLVCELRLKGRGVDKDEHGTWTNYKHVKRWWSKRKQVMKFEGKVSLECTLLDGVTKKRKCTSKSFDTAEEAAKHADMVEVEKRGKYAWTNFPLSTYINNLEKDFLPTTVITRADRTYYRAEAS